MPLKNITIYQYSRDADALIDIIRENCVDLEVEPIPAGSTAAQNQGFSKIGIPLVTQETIPEDAFFPQIGDFVHFRIGRWRKILPSAVIREHAGKTIARIMDEEQRRVGAKERKRIVQESIITLLPKAFSQFDSVSGYFDLARRRLVIGNASATRCEDIIAFLREAAGGSLPVVPLTPEEYPGALMAMWVRDAIDESKGVQLPKLLRLPDPFNIQFVKSGDAAAGWTGKNADIESEEVRELILNGHRVKRLQVEFDDNLLLTIGDDLVIRGVKMTSLLNERVKEERDPDGDKGNELMSYLTVMTLEQRNLIDGLCEWFELVKPQRAKKPEAGDDRVIE